MDSRRDEALPTVDILASGPAEEPGKRRSWWLVGAAGALAVAIVGGVTYGVSFLSGGGTQPEQVLPSGAHEVVKVDLDPSAGQKIDAARFLHRFPGLRGKGGVRDGDLRELAFESGAMRAGYWSVDFDKDVKPWLGQRVGYASYPAKLFPGRSEQGWSALTPLTGGDTAGASSANGAAVRSTRSAFLDPTVLALQVDDESAARAALTRLSARGEGHRLGWVIRSGYALLAEDQKTAQRAAELAERGTLDGDERFAADLAAVDDGIALAWSAPGDDRAPIGGALPFTGLLGASGRTHTVVTLRFAGPDVLELRGHVSGTSDAGGTDATLSGLADLPSSSMLALGLADAKSLVEPAWRQVSGGLPALRDGSAPFTKDDVRALLGDQLLAAVDTHGTSREHTAGGVRVVTAQPGKAAALMDELSRTAEQGGQPVVHRATKDGYVLATDQRQLARLASTDGATLGDLPAFRAALPDVAEARFAAWVDPAALFDAYFADQSPEMWGGDSARANLEPVAGVGVTATTPRKGEADFRVRLVLH